VFLRPAGYYTREALHRRLRQLRLR
jgi:hypothetical protein